MVKIIIYTVCFLLLILMFLFQDAFNKPIYNSVLDTYEEDEYGKSISRFFITLMIILAFFMGLFMDV